jgi:hypothetical protein
LGTPAVGILLLICTTEFSACLNIVLREGLEEEELVLWEEDKEQYRLRIVLCCMIH